MGLQDSRTERFNDNSAAFTNADFAVFEPGNRDLFQKLGRHGHGAGASPVDKDPWQDVPAVEAQNQPHVERLLGGVQIVGLDGTGSFDKPLPGEDTTRRGLIRILEGVAGISDEVQTPHTAIRDAVVANLPPKQQAEYEKEMKEQKEYERELRAWEMSAAIGLKPPTRPDLPMVDAVNSQVDKIENYIEHNVEKDHPNAAGADFDTLIRVYTDEYLRKHTGQGLPTPPVEKPFDPFPSDKPYFM